MGYGDQLMAAGLAVSHYRQHPDAGPVAICSREGKIRWSPLWDGNPAICADVNAPKIVCGEGALPYLNYPKPPGRLSFSDIYRAADHRSPIYLTDAERERAEDKVYALPPFLLIEPTPNDRLNTNRCWPLHNWERLATQLGAAGIPVYQFGHPAANLIPYVQSLWSPTFRDACALIARARLVVALEGGIPFATAALGVPTVVLWGGCVSAPTLSYPEHVNLVDDDPSTPCGWQTARCEHCIRAWTKLTPSIVAQAVITEWQQLEARTRGAA